MMVAGRVESGPDVSGCTAACAKAICSVLARRAEISRTLIGRPEVRAPEFRTTVVRATVVRSAAVSATVVRSAAVSATEVRSAVVRSAVVRSAVVRSAVVCSAVSRCTVIRSAAVSPGVVSDAGLLRTVPVSGRRRHRCPALDSSEATDVPVDQASVDAAGVRLRRARDRLGRGLRCLRRDPVERPPGSRRGFSGCAVPVRTSGDFRVHWPDAIVTVQQRCQSLGLLGSDAEHHSGLTVGLL
jgi:hypothetical protein